MKARICLNHRSNKTSNFIKIRVYNLPLHKPPISNNRLQTLHLLLLYSKIVFGFQLWILDLKGR